MIKSDLAPTDLPTDKDGAVEETGEGMEVVDEIEDIPVGETPTLTVDLEAGSYVLICNILQEEPDGTLEAHYTEGMRTGFTVEQIGGTREAGARCPGLIAASATRVRRSVAALHQLDARHRAASPLRGPSFRMRVYPVALFEARPDLGTGARRRRDRGCP